MPSLQQHRSFELKQNRAHDEASLHDALDVWIPTGWGASLLA